MRKDYCLLSCWFLIVPERNLSGKQGLPMTVSVPVTVIRAVSVRKRQALRRHTNENDEDLESEETLRRDQEEMAQLEKNMRDKDAAEDYDYIFEDQINFVKVSVMDGIDEESNEMRLRRDQNYIQRTPK
ncbi:hypothetical protein FCM35_KLT05248 [Carex littledalei]|uniref:Uncharacterized protein n=1 Tax=Carex littledalei TaxID=544730 RepID=A0A833R044_9POAL|nr:hypothetical protein FCM35_KLT05248 [Carex littledalei]